MKILSSARFALSISAAVAVLAGCGGAQSQPQIGASGPLQQSAAQSGLNAQSFSRLPSSLLTKNGVVRTAHTDHRRSWMAPDAKKHKLLYLTDHQGNGDVYVYSYPEGKLKGTLTGFMGPYGECVDKAGDIWIANTGTAQILEYAHGGTSPIATLSDPGQYPIDCSVDPTTGNLAVSNYEAVGGADGSVAIYQNAQGTPTLYPVTSMSVVWFLAYDNKGNLFVDGTESSAFQFAELTSGSSTFDNITLNQSIGSPGGVQWAGKYVAVGDQSVNVIYQFTISGSSGTKVGSTPLNGASDVVQFYIPPKLGKWTKVVAPDQGNSSVGFWKYAAGGSPTKVLQGCPSFWCFSIPVGSAVSK